MSRSRECRPIRSRMTVSGLSVLRRLNGAARSACGHKGGEGGEGSRWTGSIALYRPGGGSERHGRASRSRAVTRGDEGRRGTKTVLCRALSRSAAAARKRIYTAVRGTTRDHSGRQSRRWGALYVLYTGQSRGTRGHEASGVAGQGACARDDEGRRAHDDVALARALPCSTQAGPRFESRRVLRASGLPQSLRRERWSHRIAEKGKVRDQVGI